jgi:hypothetical protein
VRHVPKSRALQWPPAHATGDDRHMMPFCQGLRRRAVTPRVPTLYSTFALLRQNLERNHVSNARAVNVAASDASGSLTL